MIVDASTKCNDVTFNINGAGFTRQWNIKGLSLLSIMIGQTVIHKLYTSLQRPTIRVMPVTRSVFFFLAATQYACGDNLGGKWYIKILT